MKLLKYLAFLKRKIYCNHLFKGVDMQPRDGNGIIKWKCCKCRKIFSATYGLKILENGICDGIWIDKHNNLTSLNK